MSESLGQIFEKEHDIEEVPDLIPQRAMALYKRAQLYAAGFFMVYVLVGVVVVVQIRLVELRDVPEPFPGFSLYYPDRTGT